VRLVDGSRTPRELAWMLGRSVFATTVEVDQLGELGLIVTDPGGVEAQRRRPAVVVSGPSRHRLSFLAAASPGLRPPAELPPPTTNGNGVRAVPS
jgi:hypothetical protein